MVTSAGRFAPSPTGDLHLGNLRTALLAWLAARGVGGRFIVRMEDLDRVTSSELHQQRQLDALRACGLDWDGEVVCQSDRFGLYTAAIDRLAGQGNTYECFCTRREIAEAAQAPNGPADFGVYPGTCRNLTESEREMRRSQGRPPAIRLHAGDVTVRVTDRLLGVRETRVDDVVLRRNDGVPAYNLAVVVDDALQGIDQVVRGDDLFATTPRQVLLQRLLGYPTPQYVHVPLVLGADGERLAKRHGAVTLAQLVEQGVSSDEVVTLLGRSLGLVTDDEEAARTSVDVATMLARFDLDALPREPWILPVNLQRSQA